MPNGTISPEYQEILNYLKQRGRRELEETRERLRPRYQRMGMRHPEIAELETETEQELAERLAGRRAEFGVMGLRRRETLADIEAERGFKQKMTMQDWFKRFEMQEKQAMTAEKQLKTQIAGQKELQKERLDWEKEQVDEAKKAQERNLLKQIISTGANIFTGGVAGALTKGVGVGKGMLMGGTGMANIFGTQQGLNIMQQFLQRNAGIGQDTAMGAITPYGDLQYGGTGKLSLFNTYLPGHAPTRGSIPEWMKPGGKTGISLGRDYPYSGYTP